MDVSYNDYADHLIGQNSFEVIGAAEVSDTNHQYQSRDDFRVRMPDIKFEFEGDTIEGQPFTCHAYLTNPLPVSITRGYFLVEGPGLMDPLKVSIKKSVLPGEEARVTFSVTPRTSGDKTISAKFISKELGSDVDGYRSVRVARNYSIRSDFNSNTII